MSNSNGDIHKLFKQTNQEFRLYPRILVGNPAIARVKRKGKSTPLTVTEISYGGLSTSELKSADAIKKTGSANAELIELEVLGSSLTCLITEKYQNNAVTGYSFNHENAGVLLFLKDFFQFMKFGASVRHIETHDLNSPDMLPGNLRWDQSIRGSHELGKVKSSGAPDFSVELKLERVFYKLEYSSKGLITLYSVGAGGVAGELQKTITPDWNIIRFAAAYLAGYTSGDYNTPVGKAALMLAETLSHLSQSEEKNPKKNYSK
jgi:hypothetical protein